MNLNIICLILACVFFAIAIIQLIKGLKDDDMDAKRQYFMSFLTGAAFVFMGMLISIKSNTSDEMNTTKSSIELAMEDDYIFYIDGQEINPDTINIKDYSVTVKNDEKIVILSHR